MNSRSQSSGQILVVLIVLLGVVGAGFWWLFSNKQEMAKEGKEFGREAIQRIVLQRDAAFFGSRLSLSMSRVTLNFNHNFLNRQGISMRT